MDSNTKALFSQSSGAVGERYAIYVNPINVESMTTANIQELAQAAVVELEKRIRVSDPHADLIKAHTPNPTPEAVFRATLETVLLCIKPRGPQPVLNQDRASCIEWKVRDRLYKGVVSVIKAQSTL